MKLTALTVKNLFGMFNHHVPLSTSDRVTIIYGPNGYGKTTLLQLLRDLLSEKFAAVASVAFDSVTLAYSDGAHVSVSRAVLKDADLTPDLFGEPQSKPGYGLTFTARKRGQKRKEWSWRPLPRSSRHNRYRPAFERYMPWLERVGTHEWYDAREQRILSNEDVAVRYGEHIGPGFVVEEPPSWLSTRLAVHKAHLIQSQRLTRPAEPPSPRHRTSESRSTVNLYAERMAALMQRTLAESVEKFQSLDRSFPNRVLRSKLPGDVTEKGLRDRYRQQMEMRNRLAGANLLTAEADIALPKDKLDDAEMRVLWLHLEDAQEKLALFEHLLMRIELFKSILNTRYLHKTINVDRQKGVTVTNDQGLELRADQLSSGEQHELVMIYDLLFEVARGGLILIDEPEISLHVTWQHSFVADIEQISELNDLTFIIATHSPQIIHDRWDRTVSLDGSTQ